MGVDVDFYVLYGVEWEGPDFSERYSDDENFPFRYINDVDEDSIGDRYIEYDWDWCEKHNVHIIQEPYGSCWTVLGIEFLSGDLDETIKNLTEIKSKWTELVDALRNGGYTGKIGEPSIIYEGFFS